MERNRSINKELAKEQAKTRHALFRKRDNVSSFKRIFFLREAAVVYFTTLSAQQGETEGTYAAGLAIFSGSVVIECIVIGHELMMMELWLRYSSQQRPTASSSH
jgi:hypothetical protein